MESWPATFQSNFRKLAANFRKLDANLGKLAGNCGKLTFCQLSEDVPRISLTFGNFGLTLESWLGPGKGWGGRRGGERDEGGHKGLGAGGEKERLPERCFRKMEWGGGRKKFRIMTGAGGEKKSVK